MSFNIINSVSAHVIGTSKSPDATPQQSKSVSYKGRVLTFLRKLSPLSCLKIKLSEKSSQQKQSVKEIIAEKPVSIDVRAMLVKTVESKITDNKGKSEVYQNLLCGVYSNCTDEFRSHFSGFDYKTPFGYLHDIGEVARKAGLPGEEKKFGKEGYYFVPNGAGTDVFVTSVNTMLLKNGTSFVDSNKYQQEIKDLAVDVAAKLTGATAKVSEFRSELARVANNYAIEYFNAASKK